MKRIDDIPARGLANFRRGCVIPAMPLALDEKGKFDKEREKVLLRYYIDAGVGGIAVGVHSTQFEIRDPDTDLYVPVLTLASQEIDEWCKSRGHQIIKIAGAVGKTKQAVCEARTAADLGYHAVLVSLSAFPTAGTQEMVEHLREIAKVIPVIGFYLQPSVGGRLLSRKFWKEFAKVDNVLGIKAAPFNRYNTLDVVRGVCEAGKEGEVTLYTGNDDTIVYDLLTWFPIRTDKGLKRVRFMGGLLGHWGFWTQKAVQLLSRIQGIMEDDNPMVPSSLMSLAAEITDVNAAVFDPEHKFAGCIPGIHEMLRRSGIFTSIRCLNPDETLSPGQMQEIERVWRSYPHLNDQDFIRENIDEWLQ